jgi:hypothetical protein
MAERRFSNRLASNEITMRRYMTLISVECTIVMTIMFMITSSLLSSLD